MKPTITQSMFLGLFDLYGRSPLRNNSTFLNLYIVEDVSQETGLNHWFMSWKNTVKEATDTTPAEYEFFTADVPDKIIEYVSTYFDLSASFIVKE